MSAHVAWVTSQKSEHAASSLYGPIAASPTRAGLHDCPASSTLVRAAAPASTCREASESLSLARCILPRSSLLLWLTIMQMKQQPLFLGLGAAALMLPLAFATGAHAQSLSVDNRDADNSASVIAAARAHAVEVRAFRDNSACGRKKAEIGTGVLVHPAGFVLTCAHLVDDRSFGEVRFNSKDIRPFTVVARIPQHDVALLKAEPPDTASVAVCRPGQSAAEGEEVFLIGNLGNHGLATIRGNVGATGRETRTDFLHASDVLLLAVPVVPGASGGPVFDEEGRLLAMLFALAYARPNSATCFADAIGVPQLTAAVQSMVNLKSGFGLTLGVQMSESAEGCVIDAVEPDSPAADADLQVGDAIVRVGSWDVHTLLDFVLSAHAWAEQGTEVPLELIVKRDQENLTKALVLTRNVPQPIAPAALTQVKPGSQLVVTELLEGGGEGRELLRAWVRSLDGAWTKLSEDDQPRQTTWSGLLQVPFDGAYTFYLATPGSGHFRLADALVAEKTVDYAVMRVAGRQYLAAGTFPFELSMKGKGKPTQPPLYVEGPELPLQPVPDHWLWTE